MNTIIVVGGGIAGSTMAYTLLQAGHKVVLINNTQLPYASSVAAGLYNPIVFKRIVPTWLANDVVPYCKQFYTNVETNTNTRFHFDIPILKLFTEQQEVDLWHKKQLDPTTAPWLGASNTNTINGIHNKHAGKATVNYSGWVNVPLLLQAYNNYFASHANCTCINEQVNYEQLQVSNTTINYKHITANVIIFAEGVYVSNNPYFKHIQMKPTKGDVFKITANLSADYVLNKGCFLIPYASQQFIVGSTYNWHDNTWEPTPEGHAELLNKLNDIVNVPFTITQHSVGIRPTTHDRRPTLGAHPVHSNIFVFNGLGTKGVLLAPYLANHLIQHIYNNTPLMEEVNVNRYAL